MSRAALLWTLVAGLASGCATGSRAQGDSAVARQAVVEANLPELQSCWSDLAGVFAARSGSLIFAVDIRRNGTVEWVEIVGDELGLPELSACTVKRIKRWQFPADRGRRSIRFGVGFE